MKFFTPDYSRYPDSPFARDADNNLIRKAYWSDMLDNSIVTLFTLGITGGGTVQGSGSPTSLTAPNPPMFVV